MDDFVPDCWTMRDERRLKYSEEGKIELLDKTGIYQQSILNCCDSLDSKLRNIPRSHTVALTLEAF